MVYTQWCTQKGVHKRVTQKDIQTKVKGIHIRPYTLGATYESAYIKISALGHPHEGVQIRASA